MRAKQWFATNRVGYHVYDPNGWGQVHGSKIKVQRRGCEQVRYLMDCDWREKPGGDFGNWLGFWGKSIGSMSIADRQKWDAKYAAAQSAPREPSAVLVDLAEYLPTTGQALDIAGGAGRNAIWLAQRGLDVTIADISPVGLALAESRAASAGVTIKTIAIDLERDRSPAGPFDLIVSVCYLWR